MASLNKALLIGRLGKDPEVRYTADGKTVTSFSVATSEKYKDKEHTEWHNVVAWGKLGEIAGEYLTKGKLVYIEGKIQSREFEGRDGAKRKVFEVVASSLQMLDGKLNKDKKTTEGYREEFNKDDDFVPEVEEGEF